MKLTECHFFADENIQPELIQFLSTNNFDVISALSEGLIGHTDEEINTSAHRQNRIIIIQDQDFGRLIYTSDIEFAGVIYLRPGHLNPDVHGNTFVSYLIKIQN